MDITYAMCILIFGSSDCVFSHAIKYNTGGQFQTGELDEEKSPLETKSGEGNQLSALNGTASKGNANAFKGDTNASTNDESQAELTEEYTDEAELGNVTGSGKKLVIYQWRDGIVPYYVDAHSYDIVIHRRIRKALDAIQNASCLVFKPIPKLRSGHSFVHFTNPNKERECVHRLSAGRRGELVVVLGYDCMRERDIIHSVMHLLGFRDEVTHPHRDSYIRIMWDNIQPKYLPLFTINTKPTWTHKLAEYDTLSVMHFHDRAFSINGGPTILPLLPARIINPSDKLSLLDKMKLRIAFGNECNRRQVDYLVETCKNYARDGKKSKDNAAEDLCAYDKYKLTTVKYRQSRNDKKESLAGIIGVQIGQIHNGPNSFSNIIGISGINGINGINNNEESDFVGIQINKIINMGNGIININGYNEKNNNLGNESNNTDDTSDNEESNISSVLSEETGEENNNDTNNNEEPNTSGVPSEETSGGNNDDTKNNEERNISSVGETEEGNNYETINNEEPNINAMLSEETGGVNSDGTNNYEEPSISGVRSKETGRVTTRRSTKSIATPHILSTFFTSNLKPPQNDGLV